MKTYVTYKLSEVDKKTGYPVKTYVGLVCNSCGALDPIHHVASTAGPVDLCGKCMDERMGRHVEPISAKKQPQPEPPQPRLL